MTSSLWGERSRQDGACLCADLSTVSWCTSLECLQVAAECCLNARDCSPCCLLARCAKWAVFLKNGKSSRAAEWQKVTQESFVWGIFFHQSNWGIRDRLHYMLCSLQSPGRQIVICNIRLYSINKIDLAWLEIICMYWMGVCVYLAWRLYLFGTITNSGEKEGPWEWETLSDRSVSQPLITVIWKGRAN